MSIIVFIFGLVIGSFLNCVIYRLELKEFKNKNKSALKGRSFCPNCGHVLSWHDLIPVLSFIFLRGKCRYCDKKISLQYPAVEISTALIFLLIFLFFDNLLFVWLLYLVSCFLVVIFVFDLKHFIIPDSIIYSAIVITIIFNFQFSIINKFSIFNYSILSALGASLFFLLIVLISRGKGMGMGDVKLAGFMGLFLGYPAILVALFFSFLIGAIIGLILILLKKKSLKSEVPFGPFLIIGTYIALFWGERIINWYLFKCLNV